MPEPISRRGVLGQKLLVDDPRPAVDPGDHVGRAGVHAAIVVAVGAHHRSASRQLDGNPEGITRAAVLELCRENGVAHEVRDVSLAEFYRADEAFCTGTLGELVPVATIDGRPIGRPGAWPVTARLTELFTQLTATTGYRVVD